MKGTKKHNGKKSDLTKQLYTFVKNAVILYATNHSNGTEFQLDESFYIENISAALLNGAIPIDEQKTTIGKYFKNDVDNGDFLNVKWDRTDSANHHIYKITK